ncbi:MAG: TorF family putative porin [Gammaproteobacteria bacterium]|nr:TorF family putative porin [Gammaproteobacteria bacterium]NNM10356.1 hypothetical protein [Pseudomonadales bacterium]
MKSLFKAIAVASLATVSVSAVAEEGSLSLTAGAVSEYVFRGAQLGDAGAYGSLDYEIAGFYAGVWAIDDGTTSGNDGLETDFYVGYGWEQDELSLGIGYNRYEYTYIGDYEHEIALSAGFAGFGLEYVMGDSEDENVGGTSADQEYDVITLSWSNDTVGALVSQVSFDDFDGTTSGEMEYKYAELSGSKEISGLSFTATLGTQFDLEANGVDASGAGSEYIVLDVSKSFDL